MRLTFEPTAFWAVSNIITAFSASPPSKVVGVSLGIYLAVCRAFLRLAFPKLISALDWHFSHRHHLIFLLPFGSTTTFGDCRFCFILIHFGHRNPTLRYYYQVLSMKCIGEIPQHIRRVSHSRRLLCIAALILYRHFCRMVVKTYRLFLAGLEGLEPSTYGLRTTFRIRTETIIFIISKMTIMCSLPFFDWRLTIVSLLLYHWATNPYCCFYKLYFRNSK